MSGGRSAQPSPPFDPLTFDYHNVPEKTRAIWSLNPAILLATPGHRTKYDAKSPEEYYRTMRATYLSPAVYALGKDPYPGLRVNRHIPELQTTTPKYRPNKPWMGDNNILMFITPDELQQLRCVNLETDENPDIEISARFQVDMTALASASSDRSVMTATGNNDSIHPCFRRSNWKDTSDAEYEHLKPVLRIATEMMAMDGILDLWTALGKPLKRLVPTKMLRDQKEEHRVYYTGRTSPADRSQTKQEMMGLCDYVTFSWRHDDSSAGETGIIDGKRGLRPGNTRSACNIELDTHLRYIICRGGTEFDASYYNPTASNTSSYMRTQLFLATTIVHELTHAWFFNVTDDLNDLHPFRNDDRISEEGLVAETVIHKNVIIADMHTNITMRTMPFGMRADRWPGVFDGDVNTVKATAARHGIKFSTSYAIPMSYVHQFFLDDFWNNRIARFGDGALRNFKAVGVRQCRVGKLKFDPSEHGLIKRKPNPSTKAMEEDPEIESDAEFSDVDEGIIYPNKVLTLMGGVLIPPPAPDPDPDSDVEMEDRDGSDDDAGGVSI